MLKNVKFKFPLTNIFLVLKNIYSQLYFMTLELLIQSKFSANTAKPNDGDSAPLARR